MGTAAFPSGPMAQLCKEFRPNLAQPGDGLGAIGERVHGIET